MAFYLLNTPMHHSFEQVNGFIYYHETWRTFINVSFNFMLVGNLIYQRKSPNY